MIIAMANALDYQILAEGVENEQQLAYLESHGCSLILGYIFSKALSWEDFAILATPNYFDIEIQSDLAG
jgi:EAL domain-containing protein (putative c-di-GMP-specific phosphodiesterase class I)